MNNFAKTIVTMAKNQHALNTSISGTEWLLGQTSFGKAVNWNRTMYLEAAELIESYPYKHWKNLDVEADFINIGIETADLFHFSLSEGLFVLFWESLKFDIPGMSTCHKISNKEIDFVRNKFKKDPADDFMDGDILEAWLEDRVYSQLARVSGDIYDSIDNVPISTEGVDKNDTLNIKLDYFEKFLSLAVKHSRSSSMDSVEHPNRIIPSFNKKDSSLSRYKKLLASFTVLHMKVEPVDLINIYNAKSVLNYFRQDHGYKDNTYSKEWKFRGKKLEDNYILMIILSELDTFDKEVLYERLETYYKDAK